MSRSGRYWSNASTFCKNLVLKLIIFYERSRYCHSATDEAVILCFCGTGRKGFYLFHKKGKNMWWKLCSCLFHCCKWKSEFWVKSSRFNRGRWTWLCHTPYSIVRKSVKFNHRSGEILREIILFRNTSSLSKVFLRYTPRQPNYVEPKATQINL